MVSFGRKVAKAALLPLGALPRRRSRDVVILLYHRLGERGGEIGLPAHAFGWQMSYLAERARVISLDEALDPNSGGGVVITFDDGYRDFHELALPTLVRYELPSLLYLATGSMADGSGDGDGLTWSQIDEAVATGLVSVGSHTHTHAYLPGASELQAEEEMQRSKDLIEDRLGAPCRHFAYPFAIGSWHADRAARRLFDSAALEWRTNRAGRIDPYRLGRTPVLRSDGRVFFIAKVTGRLDAEASLYRLLGRGPWRAR